MTKASHPDTSPAAALARAHGLVAGLPAAASAEAVMKAYEDLKSCLSKLGETDLEKALGDVSRSLAELQGLQEAVERLRVLRGPIGQGPDPLGRSGSRFRS